MLDDEMVIEEEERENSPVCLSEKRKSVKDLFDLNNGLTARCRSCLGIYKHHGNTTNMRNHLKRKHFSAYTEHYPEKRTFKPLNIENDLTERINEENINDPSTSSKCQKRTSSGRPKSSCIDDAFKKISSYTDGEKANKVTNSLLYMIAKCGLSLSFTETEGFTRFMKTVTPHYNTPGRNTITKLMDSKYELISANLASSFNNIDFFSLTSDVWTDPFTNKSYLSLTCHYLDVDKLTLQTISLGIKKLKCRHTAQYLGQILKDMCTEWNIPDEKILSIVTDNGSNIVSAICEMFGSRRHLPCFAHTLNLVAQRSIETSDRFKQIVTKVKHIVTYFKHSIRASDELRRLQLERGKTEGTCLTLKQDCPTRWNSTYYMLDRFIELVDIVSQVLLGQSSLEMITHEERKVIIDAIKILSPLEQLTVEISGEQYLTCSKVIPLINCLVKSLEEQKPVTDVTIELHNKVLHQINYRFGPSSYARTNHFLSIATLLDPRFKKIHFASAMECSFAINAICRLLKTMYNSNIETTEKSLQNDAHTSNDDLWNVHEKIKASVILTDDSTSMPTELRQYLNSALLYRTDDPLKYFEYFEVLVKSERCISKFI